MSSGVIVGLEVLLVFGSVLGLAVFELLRLRRDRQKPAEPVRDTSTKTPSND